MSNKEFDLAKYEEEKQQAIKMINSYITRLNELKDTIDEEIVGSYFGLSCLAYDMESGWVWLKRKFHPRQRKNGKSDDSDDLEDIKHI